MTLPVLDDDALDQLVRDARPVASDHFEARVLAASHAGSRRRTVASAAAALVLVAAAGVALVVRSAPEPAPPAADRSPQGAAGGSAGSAVALPPLVTANWGDAARMLAQLLAPERRALDACFATRGMRTLQVEVRAPPDSADVLAGPRMRARADGHSVPAAEAACVDRILSRIWLPALPSSVRTVVAELALAPDAPPAPSPSNWPTPTSDEQETSMRMWSDPVRYVASLLSSSFTPKPEERSTARACLVPPNVAEPRLGPPRDDRDITVVVRGRNLHYVASSQPRAFDRCLESRLAICRALPLPPGLLELELRFGVIPGKPATSREPRGR